MKKKELKKLLRAAEAALEALRQAQAAGPAPTNDRPLSEWLDVHARQIQEAGYKQQTVKNRLGSIKHIRRLWGASGIRSLKAHEISATLRAEFLPARSSTAQRVLGELRLAYSEAIANDWCDVSPAQHVKMPKHRVMRKRLPLDVWHRMRELSRVLPRWVEAMLLLGIVTGQRRADLARMRFSDVVDGHLQVIQQKEAGKGYGARVAIPLTLRMDAIGMTVGDVIEFCRGVGKPGGTMLRTAGGRNIQLTSLSTRFAECIRAVLGEGAHAEGEWPSLHEVRSLAARTYVDQGMEPKVVQTLLGHSNLEMTQIYMDDRGLTAREFKRVEVPAGSPLLLRPDPEPPCDGGGAQVGDGSDDLQLDLQHLLSAEGHSLPVAKLLAPHPQHCGEHEQVGG